MPSALFRMDVSRLQPGERRSGAQRGAAADDSSDAHRGAAERDRSSSLLGRVRLISLFVFVVRAVHCTVLYCTC